ncbi:MAG: mannose-1-phosphate guanylyltransferase/mannose-6-phosphate isomerase [Parcubacteria group bacterium]|jgi:mannose-1-phosphate guanylyltransferase/mannose-6-phosphate isomerase
MYSVILCGGSGTRLWPLSRKNYAKQFLSLYSDKSLLQETYLRMRQIMPMENIFFVTNYEGVFNVFNQIKELDADYPKDNILVEPVSLNTAPAIALAVRHLLEIKKIDPHEPLFFLPADHYIGDSEKYLATVRLAVAEVGDHIGTIGITPLRPETGYGYIKKGAQEGGHNKVLAFKEKPDQATAQQYLDSGEYVWNSGMYVFNADTFSAELKKYSPEIYKLFSQNIAVLTEKFKTLPAISIDYAISEKSDNVITFEGVFGWNDIGSFDSLAEMKLANSNPRHINFDSKNVFVHSNSDRLIATIGVENINIIETVDSILVQKQGCAEDVKKVVAYLKEHNLPELENNLIVHRPWGKYEILVDGKNHQVKRLTVYPGAKLSLQSHVHRSEHWVVVNGTASIVNGDKEIILNENESTYISAGSKHRLGNAGATNLEIIEVQTGDYLGEDDILRYDDIYNRIGNK